VADLLSSWEQHQKVATTGHVFMATAVAMGT
jgi:hypothetical protein